MTAGGTSRGLVVAAHQAAAEAGAAALAAGGSAVDAAVATGFVLCVVDPANCGLGGYGGFLTYAPATGGPMQVDFNTSAPRRLDQALLRLPGDVTPLADGGRSVSPPAVVPGLLATHARFGRRPLEELLRPSIRLAREGFEIGSNLAGALTEHWERTSGSRRELAAIFYPAGRPPEPGERLVQTDLAATLEAISAGGAATFCTGPIVDAICETVAADGGFLEHADLATPTVVVTAAESVAFGAATVYGPRRQTSGTGVLFSALGELKPGALGPNRSPAYVQELSRALRSAWAARSEAAKPVVSPRHTTHLTTADAEGGLVALTFTHGALWLGSGLVAPGTGIVLNAGVNLLAASAAGPQAVTNMTPVVVDDAGGRRHALGGTGGPRIPGIVLSALVDVLHYGSSLSEAIAAPHLSVRPYDGAVEAEPALLPACNDRDPCWPLTRRDFGPAGGITWTAGGSEPAVDPRFDSGVARVA